MAGASGPLPFEAQRAVTGAHAAFRTWVFDHALPFWADAGLDVPGLGFREHLALDGSPADVPYKRLRVQARQIYVCSHAALLGWPEGVALAARGYDFIRREAAKPDGSWARRLGARGGILDGTADLYDLAFVLFALAWFAQASGDGACLRHAANTVDWVSDTMAHSNGGFHNSWPIEPGPRLQNPHMHLLEALLALYEVTGDTTQLDLARSLVALFRGHLLDSETGTLGEYFTDNWRPAPGPLGEHVEPGHHYEWVWLLDRYAQLSGESADAEIECLYRFAHNHGVHPASGVVVDVVNRNGSHRAASSRLWPQTEAIKAHAVMLRRGDADAGQRIAVGVNHLLERHFAQCPTGTWVDQFDERGSPCCDKIPASSFYHVFMAYGELDRMAGSLKSGA